MDRIADPTLSIRVGEAEDGDRSARELLIRIYREAKKARRLSEMPLPARLYVRELIDVNGGELPRSIGGRPKKAGLREFSLAVAVEVERSYGRSIAAAIKAVALRVGVGKRLPRRKAKNGNAWEPTVRKAYAAWSGTREIKAEMDRRRREAPGRLREVNLVVLSALEPLRMQKPPRVKAG